MPLPRSAEARTFYQAAKQRFEDAQFLLDAERTTGAIYLAGYSIECMLKALILSCLPMKGRRILLASFRGTKAHDFDWLKARYSECSNRPLPKSISKAFTFVDGWGVEFRYKAGASKYEDAKAFLDAADAIMTWADQRM